jgi:hypothetical protein
MRARQRFVAQELDVGREITVHNGFLAQQVSAQVFLVVIAEHSSDGGIVPVALKGSHRAEEICARGDTDAQPQAGRELLCQSF